MKRALTVSNILMKKRTFIQWNNPAFEDAFSTPEDNDVWFVWAKSGHGKSSFLMELIKAMISSNGKEKVLFNALEEGDSNSMRKKLIDHRMTDLQRRIVFVKETIPELEARLDKRNNYKYIIIDSWQYAQLSFTEYLRFKNKYKNKIIIITSHEDGKNPSGRTAIRVMFDAYMKIRVEGYKAFCKGREIGSNGGVYTIWEAGAEKYWGEELAPKPTNKKQNKQAK